MEPRVKEPMPLPTCTRWTRKAHGAGSTSTLTAAPGGAGHTFAFPGALGGVAPSSVASGVAPSSVAGKTHKAPSAQLQAAFQTLQTDEKALIAQIPASVTAAVKTDQATIQKAFSSLTPTQLQALRPSGAPSGTTSSSNPTANLTATLTAAGVSSSEISTITTDRQNLENALTTTDPTLQTKITADKAAIVQDGGPSLPANGPGMGMPGMF